MTKRVAVFLALVFAMMLSHPVSAHLTPNSEIRLRFEPGLLRADVLIPAAEYAYATGRAPTDPRAVRQYLYSHTAAYSPDGRPWAVSIEMPRIEKAPGGPDILASIIYTAPDRAPDRRLTLIWDAVTREVDTHYALLAVAGDVVRGVSETNKIIGTFTADAPALVIDRGSASQMTLFQGAMQLGARHILQGYDHLLFLLVLLLPSPLFALQGRWADHRPFRSTLKHLGWVVTAFTVGHSTTLLAAALANARLPSAPVEAVIALSVLIGAVHALRPLFPGREAWIAFGFGWIHGLAFATTVAGMGVGLWPRAVAIVGFNLGIELVQLMLVALLLPALVMASRRMWYSRLRQSLASFAALASFIWLGERLTGADARLDGVFGGILSTVGFGVVAVLILFVLVTLANRTGHQRTK